MGELEGFVCRAGQRQLFLDDYGIARTENLKRSMHQPVKKGAVIRPDLPWESCLQTRSAPAWDPQNRLYKLWMITATILPGVAGTTYAESEDGIHWTKPALGQCAVNGSTENNFVAADPHLVWPANAIENVVHDPDDLDASRRYKGFGNCNGREPLISADGIQWQRLAVPPIPSGDESNLSYDPLTRTYLATLKHSGPHGRSAFLSTSHDFEHWCQPQMLFHADDVDQELGRGAIRRRFATPALQQPAYDSPVSYNVDVYNMGLFRYESLYVGMPSMFHQTGKVAGDWPGFGNWDIGAESLAAFRRDGDWSGFHHVQLACSRDLRHWERLAGRQPFLDLSPVGPDVYDRGCIIGPSFPIVRDDELWFYYTGLKQYGGRPPTDGTDCDNTGAICLAVLRRDGFMSLDAGAELGTLVTAPFPLTGGSVWVNVDASEGFVQAEMLDEQGSCRAVSAPVRGDHRRGQLRWERGAPVNQQGRMVKLSFGLRNARFFSYWLEA